MTNDRERMTHDSSLTTGDDWSRLSLPVLVMSRRSFVLGHQFLNRSISRDRPGRRRRPATRPRRDEALHAEPGDERQRA